MNSISIIMPCYKGESFVQKNLERTMEAVGKLSKNYEIILVVDGNLDKTLEKATELSEKNPKIRVLAFQKNKGKGAALKYGAQFASKEFSAFIDSDLDLPPEQLKIFLTYQKETGADIVIGSKRHKLSKIDYPNHRKLLSSIYSLLIKFLFKLSVSDTQVGFKLMKTNAMKKIMKKIIVKRYAFDLEFLVVAQKLGYKIIEAPVIIQFNGVKSFVNPKAILKIFIDTCAIFYRLNILHYYDGS